MTSFTRFVQNYNVGSLVALSGSTTMYMYVALSTGAIPSFAVLLTEKLAFQYASWE